MKKEFACVYVLNRGGRPLMPCHPAKARKLQDANTLIWEVA